MLADAGQYSEQYISQMTSAICAPNYSMLSIKQSNLNKAVIGLKG